jgi:hypothetical protein
METYENVLYINCVSLEKKSYFEELLANGELYLFRSFGFKIQNDIYLDYVEIDLTIDPYVICLKFENSVQCTEFCNQLVLCFQVNTTLLYYSEFLNISGKYIIHDGKVFYDTYYTYWFGLYIIDYDLFWERLPQEFEKYRTIESLINTLSLHGITLDDYYTIERLYKNDSINHLSFLKL